MKNKKITYKEVRAIQKEDIRANRIIYSHNRHFSSPFTYIFIKLGISPNTITTFNFFIPILGFIFLSLGTYLSIIVGILFFNLFFIFDQSDGEAARLQNRGSIEGIYLDIINHYIYGCCIGLGLGYGLSRLYHNEIYIVLGFILTLIFVLEYAIPHVLNSIVVKGLIDNKTYDKIESVDKVRKLLDRYIYGGRSWANSNIISKLVGIYPFQGLIFSVHFILPIILMLTLMEIFLSASFEFPILIYGLNIGLISSYLFVLATSKIIWIIGYISRIVRNRLITKFLMASKDS